jgi:hypothetical protein
VAELASKHDYQIMPKIPWLASDIRGDVIVLLTLAMVTIGYFSTFDAPLLRTQADEAAEEVIYNEVESMETSAVAAPLAAEGNGVTEESVSNY